jgi:hypothetical protein
LKCLKNAKMHIGREMSIIEVMHRMCRHVKKSKHAQLHAQSIPMHINAQSTLTFIFTLSNGSLAAASWHWFSALPMIWLQIHSPRPCLWQRPSILWLNWAYLQFEGECWMGQTALHGQWYHSHILIYCTSVIFNFTPIILYF